MRIALICTEKLPVPPVAGGAVQLYIQGILPYLSKQHDITVFGVQHTELPNEEIVDNVKYIRVSGRTSTEYLKNISSVLNDSFDLIHVFNRPRYLLSLAEKLPNSKFSLSIHNEMFHPNKISDSDGIKCIKRTEFINAISGYIANTVISRFPISKEKLHVVYSGVDTGNYYPHWTDRGALRKQDQKAKFGIKDYRVVLFVSRLGVKKGPHIVLKAMESVMTSHKDVALVVVGSKWYGRNDADDYVKSLWTLSKNLPGPVLFTGFIPPAGIAEYFNMGDIFICASQWNEPLARVHYEAMAAGLPIITTNRGGNAEVVKDFGNGIVLDAYDKPEAFANSISYLLDNPEEALNMGKKGRQLAEEKYNWERVAAEVFQPFVTEQEVVP